MLIINGTPIKNCLDFYEHFDVAEIVRQPKTFALFAKNHLKFNKLNTHCIEVLELAASEQKLFNCTSEMSFWQGKMSELTVTDKIKSVVTETYAYYKKHGKDSQDNEWEKKFVIAAAATILAEKSFVKPVEKTFSKVSNGEIALQLDKDTLTLIPGKSYFCKYNPNILYNDGMELRTIELLVAAGYSSTAILCLNDHDKIVLNSGDRLYINVCDDSVVQILPDEIKCSHGVLKRDIKKGCVTFNGERSGIPVDASSFACMGDGKYLYVKGYRLSFLGIDSAMIPNALYSSKARYVEVAVKGSEYYLLSPKGIVKTRTGTPTAMQAHYISLQEALKEE